MIITFIVVLHKWRTLSAVRVVVSFVYLPKYFETAHFLIMKVYSCVSEFVSAHELAS